MEDFFVDILKTYGLAGAVIAAQGYAIIKLYNRNQELHDTLLEIGRESVKANESVTNALSSMAEVNRSTGGTIHQLAQMVQQLLYRGGQQ